MIWKIGDYRQRKLQAVGGRILSLYSQPFYTSRYGYKMCARIYLNGDGVGRGTHLSLFFVVMQVQSALHYTGKHLSIDFVVVKRKFYAACNCVLSNSYRTNELIQLQLQESYCLPILTYTFPGLRANASQVRELNVCWTVYTEKFSIKADGSQLNVVLMAWDAWT